LTFEKEENKKIFYERRSKQFLGSRAKSDKIVGLSTQISAFLAMFLNEPQSTHRYFGELLKSYSSRLFQENHSFYPYYTSGLGISILDEFYRENKLKTSLKRFKYHLLLMFRIQTAGENVPINVITNKAIEKYCEKLLVILWDREKALSVFTELEKKLQAALSKSKILSRQAHSTRAFTLELIPTVKGKRNFGELKYYDPIRGFGFIRIQNTDKDVFVHYTEINKVYTSRIRTGLKCSFDVYESDKGDLAKNIEIIK